MASAAKPKKAVEKQNAPHIRYPFWFGGSASSFAAMTTHPMDLVRDLETPTFFSIFGHLLTFNFAGQGMRQIAFSPLHSHSSDDPFFCP